MSHVLLVEPNDDFCLFLRQVVCDAGQRATITGSLAEAIDALRGTDAVDIIISNAALPDGSGKVLAAEAALLCKPILMLRARRERIEVSDGQRVAFRGDRLAVGEYLEKTILQRWGGRTADASIKIGGE